MNKKQKANLKKKIVNFFGAFGYLFCSLQWLFAVLLYSSFIQSLALFLTPENNNEVVEPPEITPVISNIGSTPSPIQLIITAVIMVSVISLTIYILIKLPSTIIKTGKKIVHETAEFATPILIKAQNKKETKKFHLKLSSRLVLTMKTTLVFIPIILTYLSQFIEKQVLDYRVAIYVSVSIAVISVILFTLQYIFSYLLKIKKQDLW